MNPHLKILLANIKAYIEDYGYPPDITELKAIMGLPEDVLMCRLERLQHYGMVTYDSRSGVVAYTGSQLNPKIVDAVDKRNEIYEFLINCEDRDYHPTMVEIASQAHIGIYTLQQHLAILKDENKITHSPHGKRSIRLVS